MIATEHELIIASPTIEPFHFDKISSCRCCGESTTRWGDFLGWFRAQSCGLHKLRYCPGGKAPTETKGMIQAMMTGEPDVFNPCAGIADPHLHLRCNFCGFEFLMATRENVRRSS